MTSGTSTFSPPLTHVPSSIDWNRWSTTVSPRWKATASTRSTFHEAPLLFMACVAAGLLCPFRPTAIKQKNTTARITVVTWAALVFGASAGLFRSVQQYRADRMLGSAFGVRNARARTRILRAAEGMAPSPGRIRFYLGVTLLEASQPARATVVLAQSLRDYPNLGTYLALGNAQLALNRPDLAARTFRKATRLNPRYAAAHHNLAQALRQLGRSAEALESLRRAHRLWPGRWRKPF